MCHLVQNSHHHALANILGTDTGVELKPRSFRTDPSLRTRVETWHQDLVRPWRGPWCLFIFSTREWGKAVVVMRKGSWLTPRSYFSIQVSQWSSGLTLWIRLATSGSTLDPLVRPQALGANLGAFLTLRSWYQARDLFYESIPGIDSLKLYQFPN